MARLCEIKLDFYPREIAKITARIEHFERIYGKWKDRSSEE